MFAPVQLANLRPSELALLLKVSRVTCSLWLNGRKSPHHLLQPKVDRFLQEVQRALAAGELPLPADLTSTERSERLQRVFASFLEDSTA